MVSVTASVKQHGLALAFGWRRVMLVFILSLLFGWMNTHDNSTAAPIVIGRTMLVGFLGLAAFSLFEQWPRRLPRWLARWALQLIGVVVAAPFGAWLAYWLTTGGHPDLVHNKLRGVGFAILLFQGVLFGPWIALGALVRQREAFTRNQALAFELERSELERNALDARLRLLQAQVEPHFLFNTLANVQELVDARSPQASNVLRSLIAYLRAAIPRLHEATTTLGQEMQLVRAYLE
ncbi:MAG: histidine kinase, partial [Steroidobacteraceae bacterium]